MSVCWTAGGPPSSARCCLELALERCGYHVRTLAPPRGAEVGVTVVLGHSCRRDILRLSVCRCTTLKTTPTKGLRKESGTVVSSHVPPWELEGLFCSSIYERVKRERERENTEDETEYVKEALRPNENKTLARATSAIRVRINHLKLSPRIVPLDRSDLVTL